MDSEALEAHPLSQELKLRVLPVLEELCLRLRARYPMSKFLLGGHSIGALTAYQGFTIYLECLFPADLPGRGDLLSLTVTVCHLDRTPLINAEVGWGAGDHAPPANHALEAQLANKAPTDFFKDWQSSDEWPPATEENFARLTRDLPRLTSGFQDVIECASKFLP